MAPPPSSRSPIGGGFLLAVSLIAGSLIGIGVGQPSIGFLAGAATGVALLIGVWVFDKARGN